jgi:CRISPR/Cas system CSM-associated protein Csm3 (group 7 of RAMP superfamily)
MDYKVITGTLVANTAIHIGTGDSNELTDALIRRDKDGRPFIPGTAIAGSIRALLTRLAPRLGKSPCIALNATEVKQDKPCNCAVCNLFGDINPTDENGSTAEASRLLIFNAYQDETTTCRSIIRDGVGIDRATGAAARASGVKFDMEIIPAGVAFKLRIELRDVSDSDEQLLAAGLSEWEKGRLRLGGRVSRGLGSFVLKDLQYKIIKLDDAAQLLAFLQDDMPWKKAQTEEGWLKKQIKDIKLMPTSSSKTKHSSRGWFLLEGTLQAEGPILTNDTLSSGISGFDHAPVLLQLNDWQNPVLTGAGLRGVIRSHAEKIARTLATIHAKDKNDFLNRCPACDPNVRDFNKNRKLPLESCDSLLGKYYIQGNDNLYKCEDTVNSLCLSCQLFGSTRLGSRLIVEDAHYKPLSQSNPTYKMLDFLAIDRFTGGGVDGAKFDALALWKPAFDFRMYLDNPVPWELGWLWLVIRDMIEGWLTVGFGSAKGFGRVRLINWKVTFGYLHQSDAPPGLEEMNLQTEKSGIYTTKTIEADNQDCFNIFQVWGCSFNKKVLEFQRPEPLKLTTDNYFDEIKTIYNDKGDAS